MTSSHPSTRSNRVVAGTARTAVSTDNAGNPAYAGKTGIDLEKADTGSEFLASKKVLDDKEAAAGTTSAPGSQSKKPRKLCACGSLCDAIGGRISGVPDSSFSTKWGVSQVVAYLPPGLRELPVLPTPGSRMKSSQLVQWLGLLALFSCASIWLLLWLGSCWSPTVSWTSTAVPRPPAHPRHSNLVTPTCVCPSWLFPPLLSRCRRQRSRGRRRPSPVPRLILVTPTSSLQPVCVRPGYSPPCSLAAGANGLVDVDGRPPSPASSSSLQPRHSNLCVSVPAILPLALSLQAPTVSWTSTAVPRPRLILVTPTYTRAFQAAYVTELTHTLRLVPPPLTWIVVESGNKTAETAMLLNRTAGYCAAEETGGCRTLDYVHIATGDSEDQRWFRGVGQRNLALEYIEQQGLEGVVYFMDDDNTYALQLFDELRKIRRIGVLPVGFLFHKDSPLRSYVGRPIVRLPPLSPPAAAVGERGAAVGTGDGGNGNSSSNGSSSSKGISSGDVREAPSANVTAAAGGGGGGGGGDYEGEEMEPVTRPRIVGWEAFGRRVPLQRDPEARRYIMDMAGFAFSTEALRNGTVQGEKRPIRFRPSKRGFLETDFLEQLVTHEDDFELLADGCREVWVWHKHTEDLSWAKYPVDWRPEHSTYRIPTYDWVKNGSSHEARAGLIGRIARVTNATLPVTAEKIKVDEAVKEGAVRGGGAGGGLGLHAGSSRKERVAAEEDTRQNGKRKLLGRPGLQMQAVRQARKGVGERAN
ncbi:hypothetical protein CLOM_g20267 [Closterium sp. NIES-68]|nr:hypothetical protein CLOM_g20267 [Closterium sp. NIES-68]GJP64358.1 hypothetical protein CLOP_g21362 [Closterium sp. NIES-67]